MIDKMSGDYRPRNRGQGGNRRRGGKNSRPNDRNRSPINRDGEKAKPESPIKKLIGWIFKKPKAKGTVSKAGGSADRQRPRRNNQDGETLPPFTEITSPKLYVGNLSYEALESDLFDLFSKVGAVKNVEVVMDRMSNRSKGFGFVEMEDVERAKVAAEQLNRTDFMGRQIVVSGAKTDKRAA